MPPPACRAPPASARAQLGLIRRLRTGPILVREEGIEAEPDRRQVYIQLSGLPIDDSRAEVRLDPSPDGAVVTWSASFRPRRAAWFWRAFMHLAMSGFAKRSARAVLLAQHNQTRGRSASDSERSLRRSACGHLQHTFRSQTAPGHSMERAPLVTTLLFLPLLAGCAVTPGRSPVTAPPLAPAPIAVPAPQTAELSLARAEARRQRSSDDWTRTYYLPQKQADLARRRADLQARGLAADLEVFRTWARERGAPVQGQEGTTTETREELRAVFAEEIALRMAEHGFTAGQVSGLHRRGVDVVRAFEIAGRPERPLRDAAVRAEQAVLAEVVDVNLGEDLKDGHRSTVRLWVIETLKGDAPAGRVYELRLRPGRELDGDMVLPPGGSLHPDQLKRGDRVVLFPSTAWYRLEAARAGAPARPGRPWLTFNETELIRVQNGALEGTHGTPVVSLDQLRAELRPIEQAWREVQALIPTRSQDTPVISADGSLVRPPEAFYGSWIVSTVQGKSPPSGQSPVLLQIDSGRMFARADCAHLGQLSYAPEGRTLKVGAPPRRLVHSCARGLSNHERAFSEVFRPGATARVADGALVIEGAAGEVRATRTLSSPEVTLSLLPPSPLGDAAVLFGVLEVDGRCLYVRTAGTGERVLPALMQPAARDPATGVFYFGRAALVPGSEVRLGGSMRRRTAPLDWAQAPDPSCDQSRVWVTVSMDESPAPT